MGIPRFLRSISYRPSVIKAVRALHLRRLARRLYYIWARPEGNILRLACEGIDVSFVARTPEQLRAVEAVSLGEQRIGEILIRRLQPGDIFYDIGSHVGFYTVLVAKAVGPQGEVIAFEPESQSFEHLQDNLKLNGLTNVRSFRKALGDWGGEGKLYCGQVVANFSLLSSAIIGLPTGEMGHQVVEVVEGDRFVGAENLPLPRAVKIDVEGYEYAVIRGLRQTLAHAVCELVCCEIHPRFLPAEVKPEEVLTLLKSLGFSGIDVRPCGDTFHALCYKQSART